MLRTPSCQAMLLFGLAMHSLGAEAYADCFYVGPDGGSWHIADNWSCGHVPAAGDSVRIIDDLTVRISADVPPPSTKRFLVRQTLTM